MLCLDCPNRSSCKYPCRKLREHLRSLEAGQRERPMKNIELEAILGSDGPTLSDMAPDYLPARKILDGSVSRLPPKLFAPLALHYLEGHSVSETARTLGLNKATVKRRNKAAIRLLRARGRLALPAAGPPAADEKTGGLWPRRGTMFEG